MTTLPCAKTGCREIAVGGPNFCDSHSNQPRCMTIHSSFTCPFKKDIGFNYCFIDRCVNRKCKNPALLNEIYCYSELRFCKYVKKNYSKNICITEELCKILQNYISSNDVNLLVCEYIEI